MPWRIWSRAWRRTPIHSMTQSPANTLLTPPSRSVSTSLPPLWPPSKSCRSTARAPIFVAPRRSGPALGPSAGMPNSSPQCRCAAAGAPHGEPAPLRCGRSHRACPGGGRGAAGGAGWGHLSRPASVGGGAAAYACGRRAPPTPPRRGDDCAPALLLRGPRVRRAVLRPCWAGEEAEGAEGVAGVEEDGAGGGRGRRDGRGGGRRRGGAGGDGTGGAGTAGADGGGADGVGGGGVVALAGGVVGADIAPRNTPLLRFRGRTMSREDGAVTLGFPRSQPSIDDPTAYICRRRGSIECSSLVQD